jgi:hypothetical protein
MRAWNRLPRAKQASVEAAAEHREGRVRTIQGSQRRLKSGARKTRFLRLVESAIPRLQRDGGDDPPENIAQC